MTRRFAPSLPVVFVAAVLLAGGVAPARAAETLTSAAAVLSLTAEQAGAKMPVTVTGVVTAAEPDWNGQFFVQDDTGGVFVENLGHAAPGPGDVVLIHGVSHPGAFAPIISNPTWARQTTAQLPPAKLVKIDDLNTGADDGLRVEVTGVVRTARIDAGRLLIDLSVVGHRLQVQSHVISGPNPDELVGARVRVRGTAASHYIGALRHFASVVIYAPRREDIVVLERDPTSPFDEPVLPINSVAQYRRTRHAEQRVHVIGTVTLQRAGEGLFIEDNSGGIRIVPARSSRFVIGDSVEAVGFLEYENHLPLLGDATVQRRGAAAESIQPRQAPTAEIWRGEDHARLVTMQGRILDRSTRPESATSGAPAAMATTWTVQGDAATFAVEYVSTTEDTHLSDIPIGSVVAFDGVCVVTADVTGKPTSLRLLLPRPDALRVLERPSWLTPTRLLIGLALLSAVLVVVVAWLLTVSKKNATLRGVVRELEQAQKQLQEAHDTLEQKVEERSAQLQVEMSARRTAELQFKAVLAERTRLARDLHDTLEQNLAGIALRLNTAAKLARRDVDASEVHLQFARNWLHQSQVDLRRSIWDLRSRELEEFDLANALRHSADQVIEGTPIALDFQRRGTPRGLPEIVEENVLRIAQEALANIARHAQATKVDVLLEFLPQRLRLRIGDNGVGFDPSAPKDGHFGVIGMNERMKRLGGTFVLQSAPGAGTIITIEVALPGTEPSPAAATANPVSAPA